MLLVPSLMEAGVSGGPSVLVSVLEARLLGRETVLARTWYNREVPYCFP
jgi:hypothetical protein